MVKEMKKGCADVWHTSAPKVFYACTCIHIFKALSTPECTKNSAPALVCAHAHNNGLLIISPTSPDFLLKFMKTPIQSIFIHFGQIWSILDRFDPILWKKKLSFLSTWYKALCILLNSISVQNLIVLFYLSNCQLPKTVASLINTLS